jgi:hypothetical protein
MAPFPPLNFASTAKSDASGGGNGPLNNALHEGDINVNFGANSTVGSSKLPTSKTLFYAVGAIALYLYLKKKKAA